MLKVYGFARVNKGARGNTRDLRVLWTLEEMGLPYEIVGIDHPNHDLDSPEYRALKCRSAARPSDQPCQISALFGDAAPDETGPAARLSSV